jgi:hypothetical protein
MLLSDCICLICRIADGTPVGCVALPDVSGRTLKYEEPLISTAGGDCARFIVVFIPLRVGCAFLGRIVASRVGVAVRAEFEGEIGAEEEPGPASSGDFASRRRTGDDDDGETRPEASWRKEAERPKTPTRRGSAGGVVVLTRESVFAV